MRIDDPKTITPLFDQAGFQSIHVQTHILPARYASLEMFARTEIDGWVLAGRVDTIAFLNLVHRKLKPFVTQTGAVNIPLEGHYHCSQKLIELTSFVDPCREKERYFIELRRETSPWRRTY